MKKFPWGLVWYAFILAVVFAWPGQARQDAPPNLTHTTSFVVFPQDTNANYPMLFGGKTLAEMDRCAGITTRRLLYSSPRGVRDAVTVSIKELTFHRAAEVKDLLFVTGTVVECGRSSVKVRVVVEREHWDASKEMIAEGFFVFVSIGSLTKKAAPHGIELAK